MNSLPEIIQYIVVGFAFVKTYHYVALKQNTRNVEHLLMSTLVIGYVYCNIANLIPFSICYEVDMLGIVLSAIVVAYFLAKISRSRHLPEVLEFFRIRDTGNTFFWDDLMDNDYPMKVIVKYEKIIYEGMLHNFESYSNEPHIVLAAYVVKNHKNEVKEDFSENDSCVVVLDISNAISVTVWYDKESYKCKELHELCDYNKVFESCIEK